MWGNHDFVIPRLSCHQIRLQKIQANILEDSDLCGVHVTVQCHELEYGKNEGRQHKGQGVDIFTLTVNNLCPWPPPGTKSEREITISSTQLSDVAGRTPSRWYSSID